MSDGSPRRPRRLDDPAEPRPAPTTAETAVRQAAAAPDLRGVDVALAAASAGPAPEAASDARPTDPARTRPAPDAPDAPRAASTAPARTAPAMSHPPLVEPPSPDVVVAATSRIPGAAREGYTQLPTAPVVVSAEGPVEGQHLEWAPPPPAKHAAVAPWALALAIVALAASIFVGWMLPIGLAGAITAIVALRRAGESRAVAVWALMLSLLAIAYSTGWLLWAIPRLG